jgi:hypothetical protein
VTEAAQFPFWEYKFDFRYNVQNYKYYARSDWMALELLLLIVDYIFKSLNQNKTKTKTCPMILLSLRPLLTTKFNLIKTED